MVVHLLEVWNSWQKMYLWPIISYILKEYHGVSTQCWMYIT